jgi:hypothetical protein
MTRKDAEARSYYYASERLYKNNPEMDEDPATRSMADVAAEPEWDAADDDEAQPEEDSVLRTSSSDTILDKNSSLLKNLFRYPHLQISSSASRRTFERYWKLARHDLEVEEQA